MLYQFECGSFMKMCCCNCHEIHLRLIQTCVLRWLIRDDFELWGEFLAKCHCYYALPHFVKRLTFYASLVGVGRVIRIDIFHFENLWRAHFERAFSSFALFCTWQPHWWQPSEEPLFNNRRNDEKKTFPKRRKSYGKCMTAKRLQFVCFSAPLAASVWSLVV